MSIFFRHGFVYYNSKKLAEGARRIYNGKKAIDGKTITMEFNAAVARIAPEESDTIIVRNIIGQFPTQEKLKAFFIGSKEIRRPENGSVFLYLAWIYSVISTCVHYTNLFHMLRKKKYFPNLLHCLTLQTRLY